MNKCVSRAHGTGRGFETIYKERAYDSRGRRKAVYLRASDDVICPLRCVSQAALRLVMIKCSMLLI